MGLDSWRKSRPILREKCPFRGTCPRKGQIIIFFLRLRPQELCEAFFRGRFFDSLSLRVVFRPRAFQVCESLRQFSCKTP